MPRDHEDLARTLTAFTGWIRDQPTAGVTVAAVRRDAKGSYVTNLGHVDCDPVALVVVASELLSTASELIHASPHAEGAGFEVLSRIARAQRALGLTAGRSDP